MKQNINWWVRALGGDKRSSEIAVTAGYGSGKTYGAWQWLLSEMNKYPDGKVWGFTEPTYGLINRVAIAVLRNIATSIQMIEGRDFTINSGTEPSVNFKKYNQKVLLLSMDNPDSIVGFELCKCVEDEAALSKEESDRRLANRMRGKGVNLNQIVKITTPEGLNWFADKYDSDTLRGWNTEREFDHFKIEEIQTENRVVLKGFRRIRLTTYMNQANLPFDYVANIMQSYGHDENYIDSYVYGHLRPFNKGLAYKDYRSVIHKVSGIEADPGKLINLTWDFNIRPVWVAIQEYLEIEPFTRERKTYDICLDNANQDGETLTEAIAEFVIKFPAHKFGDTPIHLYGDASGHSESHKNLRAQDTDYKFIQRLLRAEGYRYVVIAAHSPPNPLERLSVEAVNTAFLKGALRINDTCDRVLKSISRTVWSGGAKVKLDKPKNDTWTHPMDAVKYYIWAKDNNKRVLI